MNLQMMASSLEYKICAGNRIESKSIFLSALKNIARTKQVGGEEILAIHKVRSHGDKMNGYTDSNSKRVQGDLLFCVLKGNFA